MAELVALQCQRGIQILDTSLMGGRLGKTDRVEEERGYLLSREKRGGHNILIRGGGQRRRGFGEILTLVRRRGS